MNYLIKICQFVVASVTLLIIIGLSTDGFQTPDAQGKSRMESIRDAKRKAEGLPPYVENVRLSGASALDDLVTWSFWQNYLILLAISGFWGYVMQSRAGMIMFLVLLAGVGLVVLLGSLYVSGRQRQIDKDKAENNGWYRDGTGGAWGEPEGWRKDR